MKQFKLTFTYLRDWCELEGIVFQRKGKGYEYWNKDEGGGTVGEAETLEEAWWDVQDFTDIGMNNCQAVRPQR